MTLQEEAAALHEKLHRNVNAPGKRGPSPRELEAAEMIARLLAEIERKDEALLDAKADKVGREVAVDLNYGVALRNLARALILPDPIDPDLLEAFIAESGLKFSEHERMLVAGVFGWLAKRELAKEQDRG